jgi:hypothetical protein
MIEGRSEWRIEHPCSVRDYLLDLPQPVGFVLVGIIACRRWYQPRTFSAKVFETTAHRL